MTLPTLIKHSTTAAATPGAMQAGQIAINEADSLWYYRNAAGTVVATPIGHMLADLNVIINGAGEVAQWGTGGFTTSGTASAGYGLDQWQVSKSQATMQLTLLQTTASGVALFPTWIKNGAPTGFSGAFAAGDYVIAMQQPIEGLRWAPLGFGAAGARTVNIGFWAASNLASQIIAVSLSNGATANRSYVVDVTLGGAGIWTWNVVSIPGDTAGTWATDNSNAATLRFASKGGSTLQVPATGAWQAANYTHSASTTNVYATTNNWIGVTGVIITVAEVPPNASATAAPNARRFFRPFNQEMTICQRYYEKSYLYETNPGTASNNIGPTGFGVSLPSASGSSQYGTAHFRTTKRALPTMTAYSIITGTSGQARDVINNADVACSGMGGVQPGPGAWAVGCAPSVSGTTDAFAFHWVADARL
jgi:hypothetical protein